MREQDCNREYAGKRGTPYRDVKSEPSNAPTHHGGAATLTARAEDDTTQSSRSSPALLDLASPSRYGVPRLPAYSPLQLVKLASA